MNAAVPLLLHGATGRMGSCLLAELPHFPRLRLVAAAGRSVATLSLPPGVVALAQERLGDGPKCDLVIDFSLPEAFDAVLATAVARRAALVSGTTGLSQAQFAALDAAARTIPLLWSANFSLGVAVLADLVARAAARLPGWALDIIDQHHALKKDAPSGTALMLGDAARAGGGEPRFASIRAGDIVGEHNVQLTGMGERIEIVHRAMERAVFARGALASAQWLVAQAPGRYAMQDWVAAQAASRSERHGPAA